MPMYTIDISNDDIQLMVRNPKVWISSAAVDPKLIWNMRLMAMKLNNIQTPDYFNLEAKNIKTSELNEGVTMENLVQIVEGWGNADDPVKALNTPEIQKLYVNK